ncbi:MAG TPA: SLC13 family permease [Thermoplasmata archaeon]
MINEIVSLVLLFSLLIAVALDVAHRTTIAMGVAIAAVVVGSILPYEGTDPARFGQGYFPPWVALQAVNFETLIFLVGMGVFVAIMQQSGAFDYVTKTLVLKSKMQPGILFVRILLLSYGISCFVNNVSVIFIMVPITLNICRQFGLDPVPFSVIQVAVINLGGASTMVGDFPNIIIATSGTNLSFVDFQVNMFPACFALVIASILLFRRMHREYFTRFEPGPAARAFAADLAERRDTSITDRRLLQASVVVLVGMLGTLVFSTQLGIPLALIPAVGAAIILILYEMRLRVRQPSGAALDKIQRRNLIGDEVSKILSEVHWDVVLFLMALFVVVGSLQATAVLDWAADFILGASSGDPLRASMLIVVIGSIVSLSAAAGPATAVFVPVIKKLSGVGSGGLLYWALSLGVQAGSSTTLIGANEGPLAARMIEQDSRAHNASSRLDAKGFSRIGGRLWLMMIPLSILYLAGIITLGWIVSVAALVIALVGSFLIAVRGI